MTSARGRTCTASSDVSTDSGRFQQESVYNPSHQLTALSDYIARVQRVLRTAGPATELFVAGSGALAILDNVHRGLGIELRDLDLFVVWGQNLSPRSAAGIGSRLEAAGAGAYRPKVDPRVRANPNLGFPQGSRYVVGYSLYFDWPGGGYLDLSLYRTGGDVRLNGILNTDTTMLPLGLNLTLADFARRELGVRPYDELCDRGRVDDRHGGYQGHLGRNLKVVNWANVERSPVVGGARVIRTFAQSRQETPGEVLLNLWRLAAIGPKPEPKELSKLLLVLVEDVNLSHELRTLQKAGLLAGWAPALDAHVSGLSDDALARWLNHADDPTRLKAPPSLRTRITALLGYLPRAERRWVEHLSRTRFSRAGGVVAIPGRISPGALFWAERPPQPAPNGRVGAP